MSRGYGMSRKGRGEECPLKCDLSHDACDVTNQPPNQPTNACDNITFPRAVIKVKVAEFPKLALIHGILLNLLI